MQGGSILTCLDSFKETIPCFVIIFCHPLLFQLKIAYVTISSAVSLNLIEKQELDVKFRDIKWVLHIVLYNLCWKEIANPGKLVDLSIIKVVVDYMYGL